MISFKHGISILLLLPLVACVKASRQSPPGEISNEVSAFGLQKSLIAFNNHALFEAGSIELENIQFSRATDDSFKQVDQVRLWLKVCGIRDRATQGTIRNEKFHISSEIGDNIFMTRDDKKGTPVSTEISNPITVNQGNCLRWSQLIPAFNYVASSANITLHFEIKNLAGTLGTMVRRVGFNPWDMYRSNSKTKGFLDLTDYDKSDWGEGQWVSGQENVIAALKGELFDNNAQLSMRSLTVQPLERENQNSSQFNQNKILAGLSSSEKQRYLSIRQDIENDLRQQSGLQINVNMSAQPFIRFQDATGVPHDMDINSGRFRIHMNYIAARVTEGGEKFLLSSNVSQITGRGLGFTWDVGPNGLLASTPLVLKNKCEYCRVELAVKIEPVSRGLRGIKPFTAVYDLGEYDNWMRRQSPEFRFDENYQPMNRVEYDKYIENTKGYNTAISTLRPQERFYFGPLTIRFVRITPGETATDRTLQYRVESCIEHGLYGNRVGRGLQFEVITEDEGRPHRMVRKTNENGCLMWFGFLSHKYYRKEVLQEKFATVRYLDPATQTNADGEPVEPENASQMVNPFERRFTYYINPWDEKFTFGWDEPDLPNGYYQETQDLQDTAPFSKLFIADFKYQTMGFRYEIDRFLRLRVKKAVLLQTYPYVLKYNSIVEGRLRTEPLRDGIYLMKVALHKYYLDPATRGVRIYDENEEDPFEYAALEENSEIKLAEIPNLVEMDSPSAYNLYDETLSPPLFQNEMSPRTAMEVQNKENTSTRRGFRLLEDDDLNESRKEYISHQTKLVRVQGGQIITPIEFDMQDLRLMRIRNQFLIQLETIDERLLRQATFVDSTLNDMNQQGNIEGRLAQIYEELDNIENLESEISNSLIEEAGDLSAQEETLENLERKRISLDEARKRLHRILGLDHFEEGSDAYRVHLEKIEKKLELLQDYRARVQEEEGGVNYENQFRNFKRSQINSVMRRLRQDNYSDLDQVVEEESLENRDSLEKDPFLRYMFMDSQATGSAALSSFIEYRAQQAEERDDESLAVDLRSLQLADFTETPLTPSFDFEMLRNDGEHDHTLPEDDGKSGLPSRTFLGPLTFVFNTNGSALRPTDILNERVCPTAFCETPRKLIHDLGVAPAPVERAADVDENGDFMDLGDQAIYSMGESVNKDYENNRYYGYLKVYSNVTVDDLIEREQEIRELDYRRMEQGAQIINFVETHKLKYTLLESSDPRSALKSIDHICAETIEIDKLSDCFSEITSGPQIFPKDDLLAQLNNRERVDENYIQYLNRSTLGYNQDYYHAVEGQVHVDDIRNIMEKGWQNPETDADHVRRFAHRMCHVLARNLIHKEFTDRIAIDTKRFSESSQRIQDQIYLKETALNKQLLEDMELRCHQYLGHVYDYFPDQDAWFASSSDRNAIQKAKQSGLRPVDVNFSPIVIERKLRVYKTTDRYQYKGGKSLNINVSANFNLASGQGSKSSTTTNFKPWEAAVGVAGAIIGGTIGGPMGVAAGIGAGALLGNVSRTVVGGLGVTRSMGRDESIYLNEGVSVAAGTFLVNQQATFDIELGEYERCLVVRLHPSLIRDILDREPLLQGHRAMREGLGHVRDNIDSQGVLICSGQPTRQCLPVKEKYYYFTQHFTEGDMLDTADLHNHPWLLQMRGYRDFQAFTATIGAREVPHLRNEWFKDTFSKTMSDATSLRLQGSREDNLNPQFEVINKNSEINWSLDELGRVYFGVLPTFPSLYTYIDESGQNVSDWPYEDTDPGQAFPQCEQ